MIIHPAYFPNIESFQKLIQANEIIFEVNDYYEKQTYRTRCNIYSPNGLQSMNIPIKHAKKEHQPTKDVIIENDFPWQKNHFKTLQNSYRSSPYFEFYEDEIATLYHQKEKHLIEFNIKSIELIFKLLQKSISSQKTTEYFRNYTDQEDYRELIVAKTKNSFEGEVYTQVYEQKHGFIPNLSALDLLFNEGPNSIAFL